MTVVIANPETLTSPSAYGGGEVEPIPRSFLSGWIEAYVFGTNICRRGQAIAKRRAGASLGLLDYLGVVHVHECDPFFREGCKEVSFFVSDFLFTAEKFDMSGSNVRYETDGGLSDFGESCDFSAMIHAHFDHSDFIFLTTP